jgi:IclR family acetate operon transcriptional repressor
VAFYLPERFTVLNRGQADDAGFTRAPSGVHSIERAFELLEAMADAGGRIGLSELADRVGFPKPTVHRLVRTLVALDYVRQEPNRDYALGPRLIRLVDASSRLLGLWAAPHLQEVVDELGESANLAMLEGCHVVDVSQVAGRHAMRMVSEVGSRTYPHCTAAGKAMLAEFPPEQVKAIVQRTGMPRFTAATITDLATLRGELALIHDQGYATDDEEQELGVRCVAVAVPGAPVRAAVSISAPLPRMTDDLIKRAVPILSAAARKLADELHLVRPNRLS